MKPGRFLAPLVLLACSGLVAAGLAEGALRIFATTQNPLAALLRSWDPFVVKVLPHGQNGYRPRPGATFAYAGNAAAHENAAGYRGPLVTVPKPAGTVRVILLGESTTHGWGVNDDETIDAYLRTALGERLTGRTVDVVNLAFDGYDAYQIWQRLRSDGVPLQPDAIVLNTGINDVRNARYADLTDPDPRTLIWEGEVRRLREEAARGGPKLWTRIKHYLYLARLPGVLRQARQAGQTGPRRSEQVHPDAADNFARNVDRIADEAAHLGVPLLLSTPPSIITRTDGPVMTPKSYWIDTPRVTQDYRDTLAARLVAIARDRSARGQSVSYVPHATLPSSDFLDDCHLAPAGNRAMAAEFAAALAPLLQGPPAAPTRRAR